MAIEIDMPNCQDCRRPVSDPSAVCCYSCAQALREELASVLDLLREFGQCSICYRAFREPGIGCEKCGEVREKLL